MKKFLKKTEGFTLVELIVVIAILGILTAVAVPAYTGYIEKSKETGDVQVLGAVKTAADAALALETEGYDELKVEFVTTTTGEGANATTTTTTTVTAVYPDGDDTGTDPDELVLMGTDAADTDFATYFEGNTIEFKSKKFENGATWTAEGWAGNDADADE